MANLSGGRLIGIVFWSSNRIRYDVSDIKRSRITVIGEKLDNHNQRPSAVPIRVNTCSVCSEFGCSLISSSRLIAGHLPDVAGPGRLELSSQWGEVFCVDWKRDWTSLQSCIRTSLQPGDDGVVQNSAAPIASQEHTVPIVDLELESLDTCVTTPLTELHRSKPIMLGTPGSERLQVWISISRETFIGRSRYELGIHGEMMGDDRDKRKTASDEPISLVSLLAELNSLSSEEGD